MNTRSQRTFSRDCSNPARQLTPEDAAIMARLSAETRGGYWHDDVPGWSIMVAAEAMRETYPRQKRNNARAVHGMRWPDEAREVLP